MVSRKSSKAMKAWIFRILITGFIILSALFMATTIMFIIGMLPSIVVVFLEKKGLKYKAYTVAAMNFAGCAPFLFSLWQRGGSYEQSMLIITDQTAIVVMYTAAAVGYMMFWAVQGIVSSLLFQQGQQRLEYVKKRKQELFERWGGEVTGKVQMDHEGFAHDPEELKKIKVN